MHVFLSKQKVGAAHEGVVLKFDFSNKVSFSRVVLCSLSPNLMNCFIRLLSKPFYDQFRPPTGSSPQNPIVGVDFTASVVKYVQNVNYSKYRSNTMKFAVNKSSPW